MSFPNQLQTWPGVGVAGDRCSLNTNNFSLLAGQGAFVAGSAGVTIGNMAWVDYGTGIVTSFGSGLIGGFISREQQGLITQYLGETSFQVAPGYQVTVHSAGDFWVKNTGTTVATPGQKAYANYATGAITFAATGSPPTGAVVVGGIASSTATFTAAIAIPATPANAPGTMTVSAVSSGTLSAGGTVTGLTSVAAGTTIVTQLTGTAGGTGTYEVSIPQTVVSSTGTATNGLLTVSGTTSGTLSVGQVMSGSGVTAGTAITQIGTYNGTTGTVYVNYSQTVSGGTTLTVYGGVETRWTAYSFGQTGELVKISTTAQG
jgi:hypothetical protein